VSARGWSLFIAVSLIWGIPYLLIKLALNGGMTPATLAEGRIVLAAALLLAVAARRGTLPALRGRLAWIALFGLVEIAAPFLLIAAGESRAPSSLAAIVIATVPLITAVLTLQLAGEEQVGALRFAGMLVGFAGVVALVGLEAASGGATLAACGLFLLASCGYAIGPIVISRRLRGQDATATMGASLAVAGVLLAPLALLDLPPRTPSAGALAAVAVLGVLCTAVAFVLMALLVFEAGPTRSTIVTYVNPLVAVLLGVLFLDERLTPGAASGLVLILAGSWLATLARRSPARAAGDPAPSSDDAGAGTRRAER